MDIPNKFKIANQVITISLEDKVTRSNGDEIYGLYDDVNCTIKLAKKVNDVELSEEQILNTKWHEIFHVFQSFYDNSCDEAEAQTFANFMREYESTKSYD